MEKIKNLEVYKKCLIVVDMVNGFVREGVLHDERIATIIPKQVELIKKNQEEKELTIEEQKLIMQQEGLDQDQQKILLEKVQQIVNQGYALSLSERIEGLLSISSPILDSEQNIIGGLSISGPVIRMGIKQQHMIQSLVKASVEISKKMGYV